MKILKNYSNPPTIKIPQHLDEIPKLTSIDLRQPTIQKYLPQIKDFQIQNNLESIPEALYIIQNPKTQLYCNCGNKKNFLRSENKRYGDFCSKECISNQIDIFNNIKFIPTEYIKHIDNFHLLHIHNKLKNSKLDIINLKVIYPYILETLYIKIKYNFSSIQEAFYHLINYNKIDEKEWMCRCGKRKNFRGTVEERYGVGCSNKCSRTFISLQESIEKLSNIEITEDEMQVGVGEIRNRIKNPNIHLATPKYNDIIKYIIKFQCDYHLDSIQEALYLILNPNITKPICGVCGSRIKYRGSGKSIIPYGEFCSTQCSNKVTTQIKEYRKKKSESCISFYRNNPKVAKLRGLDVSKFWKKEREENSEYYKLYIEMKKEVLGEINNREDVKEKKKQTMIFNGHMTPDELLEEKALYYRTVERLQSKFKKEIEDLPNSEKRGRIWERLEDEVFHLDHIYSKHMGFKNNIDPKYIAHITNLEFIPGSKNCSKNKNCNKTTEELISDFEKYEGSK